MEPADRASDNAFQRKTLRRIGSYQRFNRAAQLIVAAAGIIKKGGLFDRRQVHSLMK
jgi:hypothetical protein